MAQRPAMMLSMVRPPSHDRAQRRLLQCLLLIGLLPQELHAEDNTYRVIQAELNFDAYSAARPSAEGFGLIVLFCRGIDPHAAERISLRLPKDTKLRDRSVPIGSITLRGETIEEDDERPMAHLHPFEITQGPHGIEVYFTLDARIVTDPSYSGTIDHDIPFQISF